MEIDKASKAVEIVRKMKKEKALKIANAYKVYRLKKLLRERYAARKILRWLTQIRRLRAAVTI